MTGVARKGTKADVVIVGAGPSGSAAAIALARAGRSVILVERQRFPRNKVCGGCLSGPALLRLRSILGQDAVLPGGPATEITFVIGSHRATCRPQGATWMAPRAGLDSCLTDAASAAGAEIRFGTPAGIERGVNGWTVAIGDERIHAGFVLIATGLAGLARKVGIRARRTASPMLAQQWVRPAEAPLPQLGSVELHWLRGGYVGLATPEAGRCVVALATCAKASGGYSALDRLRRSNPGAPLWTMLSPSAPQEHGAGGTAGFPWLPERLGDENLLLIGDGAGYAEPFTGAGIGQALFSADCASRAILTGGPVIERYTTLMRAHSRQLDRTRWISSLLKAAEWCLRSSKRRPPIERWLGRWVARVHIRGEL